MPKSTADHTSLPPSNWQPRVRGFPLERGRWNKVVSQMALLLDVMKSRETGCSQHGQGPYRCGLRLHLMRILRFKGDRRSQGPAGTPSRQRRHPISRPTLLPGPISPRPPHILIPVIARAAHCALPGSKLLSEPSRNPILDSEACPGQSA
jgi:hypothetical protein